jgi:hypothetical protein
MQQAFEEVIKDLLKVGFGDSAESVYAECQILQYIAIKTRSADRGAKARSSFGNLYAIYVLVEDYLRKGYDRRSGYGDYEGAKFSDLFRRQRQMPFGQKLQNHALNHRLNEEFRRFFPTCKYIPVLRNGDTNRYWFNEKLLTCRIGKRKHNIARMIVEIIDRYVTAKKAAFSRFIAACENLRSLRPSRRDDVVRFIEGLLAPNVDARLFEVVSFGILKHYYHGQTVYFGYQPDEISEENLALYKTGRTNANDGGIDFVMKPLGRFFQVTESTDVHKFFLDIDKIERYPVTFVVKSDMEVEVLRAKMREHAQERYPVKAVVAKYMACIEEIINIPVLLQRFREAVGRGYLSRIMAEIVKQSKVEFNIEDE